MLFRSAECSKEGAQGCSDGALLCAAERKGDGSGQERGRGGDAAVGRSSREEAGGWGLRGAPARKSSGGTASLLGSCGQRRKEAR